jgi:predicted DNA-binding protein (UPF0251 family)
MQMTKLYILSDGDGPVRYVGKTSQSLARRLSSHRSTASRRDDYRARWVRSAKNIRIDLVDEVQGDGCVEEIALIASLKLLGARLTNHTAGGEGALGRSLSTESRERISAKLRGRICGPRSAETRTKLSAALKGRKPSAQTTEALRRALTGRKNGPLTPECKARISASKIRITAEMIETGRQLHMLGWSQQRVADALGVSQSQFSLRLKGRCR